MTYFSILSLLVSNLFFSGLVVAGAPEDIENSFFLKYPAAKIQKWERDSHGNWEAHFKTKGRKYKADFSEDGDWIETETNVSEKQLPLAIKEVLGEKYRGQEIAEIEEVDHSTKGHFFDVEFARKGKNIDVEFRSDGRLVTEGASSPGLSMGAFFGDPSYKPFQSMGKSTRRIDKMALSEIALEFFFNLAGILIFSWWIYFRRYRDHQMFFLLLAFNLFLYPVFAMATSLTAGVGFTIFALLSLVRLRSDTFSKTEVAYLLGSVALTFVNAMLPVKFELFSTAMILLTTWFGDHAYISSEGFHTVEFRHEVSDKHLACSHVKLKQELSEIYSIDVERVNVLRIDGNVARIKVAYRERPESKRPVLGPTVQQQPVKTASKKKLKPKKKS